MIETIFIYELYDPRTSEVPRYIGVTNDPERRLREHLCEPRDNNPGKYDWIRRLLSEGVRPSIRIIDEVSFGDWEEAERNWIAARRLEFTDLLNISSGGRGGSWMIGMKRSPFTEEHRQKLSDARKRRAPASEETRKRMSAAALGRVFSEEHKRKIAEAHRGKPKPKLSEEHKRKIGEAGRGRLHTDAAKLKMSEALKKAHKRGAFKKYT